MFTRWSPSRIFLRKRCHFKTLWKRQILSCKLEIRSRLCRSRQTGRRLMPFRGKNHFLITGTKAVINSMLIRNYGCQSTREGNHFMRGLNLETRGKFYLSCLRGMRAARSSKLQLLWAFCLRVKRIKLKWGSIIGVIWGKPIFKTVRSEGDSKKRRGLKLIITRHLLGNSHQVTWRMMGHQLWRTRGWPPLSFQLWSPRKFRNQL